jgi:hypothetical protein
MERDFDSEAETDSETDGILETEAADEREKEEEQGHSHCLTIYKSPQTSETAKQSGSSQPRLASDPLPQALTG